MSPPAADTAAVVERESRLTFTPGRVYGYFATTYRRTWRGSIVSSFLNPVLFLLAMGIGLGTLVDRGQASGAASLGGLSYREFIAPGLLAATAMQTAAAESTYPVMANIKWLRIYFGMLASPVGVRSIVAGHQLWVTTRLFMTCTIFLAVMAAFGAAHSPAAVLAVPAGVLTGMAFAAPIAAFAATQEGDAAFSGLFRFVIVPMFLFSGTFFPVSQLPAGIRPVAYATPLWHGVALTRNLALGGGGAAGDVGHAAYLVAWWALGWWVAVRTHRRRLVV